MLAILAVDLWCVRRRDQLAAITLPCVVAGAALLDAMLKQTFARPRPTLFAEIALPTNYAFPSGHLMVSVATYGMIAAVVSRELPRARWSPFVIALLVVLAIGFSRVYLGVHWPTDVLGGLAAGACCVLIGDAILELSAAHVRTAACPGRVASSSGTAPSAPARPADRAGPGAIPARINEPAPVDGRDSPS